MDLNENGHYRGLHIVAIDPSTAKPLFAKVFDTYKSSEAANEFVLSNPVPKGHIVVAACKDDM